MRFSIYFLLVILIAGCSSTKNAASIEELTALSQRLNTTPHRFAITTVFPQNTTASQQAINDIIIRTGNSANRINVAADGHYFKIDGQMVESSLPFFGEQRISSGYSNDMGLIEINDQVDDLNYTVDDGYLRSNFTASGKDNQSYDVTIRVLSTNNVELILNGSHKAFIRYAGTIDFLEETVE